MILSVIGLIGLCMLLAAVVWLGVYFCMNMNKETIEIKPIYSADDWFE